MKVGMKAASSGLRMEADVFSALNLPIPSRYYVRLIINGKTVGTSQTVTMQEDFTIDFGDVFR
jgi:hypothetical protein